jgi:G:T/U-mismatch repair DNA glycosylase
MDFYYPNFNNDMWRILGAVFFDDRNYFVQNPQRIFDREKIVEFLVWKGIGIYDTAEAVERLKGNASDAFLKVLVPTDVKALLRKIPHAKAVVTTGTLATRTLAEELSAKEPPVGGKSPFSFDGSELNLYRMPSSSRAYPLAFEKKAEVYRKMFSELQMVP